MKVGNITCDELDDGSVQVLCTGSGVMGGNSVTVFEEQDARDLARGLNAIFGKKNLDGRLRSE